MTQARPYQPVLHHTIPIPTYVHNMQNQCNSLNACLSDMQFKYTQRLQAVPRVPQVYLN